MKSKKLIVVLALVALAGVLSSCVPLAAGAAGGYLLRDEGYEVQSPITN
jgi:hypothetical protein